MRHSGLHQWHRYCIHTVPVIPVDENLSQCSNTCTACMRLLAFELGRRHPGHPPFAHAYTRPEGPLLSGLGARLKCEHYPYSCLLGRFKLAQSRVCIDGSSIRPCHVPASHRTRLQGELNPVGQAATYRFRRFVHARALVECEFPQGREAP